MDLFKTLFGLKAAEVRRTCVVMPFIVKGVLEDFGIKRLTRGRLYGAGNSSFCTVLHTRMGPAFTGDAVLYLDATPCRNIVLFGTCGLLSSAGGLKIGTLVSPSRCYAQESFTGLLTGAPSPRIPVFPDPRFRQSLLSAAGRGVVKDAVGLSVGSLKLQEGKKDGWLSQGIRVVDLECAAFFAAAARIGRKAAALLVITDLVEEKPFYADLEKNQLSLSIRQASHIICEFTKKKQNA